MGVVHGVQPHTLSSANLLAERGSFAPGCKELICEATAEKLNSDQLILTGVGSHSPWQAACQCSPPASTSEEETRVTTLITAPACGQRPRGPAWEGRACTEPIMGPQAPAQFTGLLCAHTNPSAEKHCIPHALDQSWAPQRDVVEKLKVYFIFF